MRFQLGVLLLGSLLRLAPLCHAFSRGESLRPTSVRRPAPRRIPAVPIRRSTELRGIPMLFRWLTNQYPSVNKRISDGFSAQSENIDCLYLDMNGIIHTLTHGNADGITLMDEKGMLQRIFTYTDRIYKLVQPDKMFFMAGEFDPRHPCRLAWFTSCLSPRHPPHTLAQWTGSPRGRR